MLLLLLNVLVFVLHVSLQFVALHEGAIAVGADERLVVGVDANVLRQLGGIATRYAACAANEGQIGRIMGAQVARQVVLLRKCPAANCTRVRLFARVDSKRNEVN